MKFSGLRLILLFAIGFAVASLVSAQGAEPGPEPLIRVEDPDNPHAHIYRVRATAYCHSEADHVEFGRYSASGEKLKATQSYTSVAADWSRFPLGTVFTIVGYPGTYVVDDYGIALVGKNTIDIYCPNEEYMDAWGARTLEIKILEYGDPEESARILKERLEFGFCKAMHDALLASIRANSVPRSMGSD